MVRLRLGPLLRYVDEDTATVWIETDKPCEAEVVCEGSSAGGSARTWQVSGHHYALITVVGLQPGTETPYRVLLDGVQVWPEPGSALPPSRIRTPEPGTGTLDVAFGSCRWASRPAASPHDPAGPDALDALAQRALLGGELPDVLLLLGDQVYADETSERVKTRLAARRDLSEPPWDQVADFDEYTELYDESWLDPEVRWLLSTVPSLMIFDDHDVIDDWNTSEAWRSEMRATGWWRERILSGLASYWVYQHLGNLSPGELAEDPVYTAVRQAEDGTAALREFTERADSKPETVRWSYRRDLGRVRLVMIDTRAGRVLEERERAMLDEREMEWLREQVLTSLDGDSPVDGTEPLPHDAARAGAAGERQPCSHLLIGTSLPWLLPPAIHDTEAWNAALCGGSRGPRWAKLSEKLRRAADLEHWAAYPRSFAALTELVQEVAASRTAPATVNVLSGDVHHAYIGEPRFPEPVKSRVLQLTCSPMHNSVPAVMRWGFRFGWSRPGRWLGRALARHGRAGRPPVKWRRAGGPWFGNQVMILRLRGDSAELSLEQARAEQGGGSPGTGTGEHGRARLESVLRQQIAPGRDDVQR